MALGTHSHDAGLIIVVALVVFFLLGVCVFVGGMQHSGAIKTNQCATFVIVMCGPNPYTYALFRCFRRPFSHKKEGKVWIDIEDHYREKYKKEMGYKVRQICYHLCSRKLLTSFSLYTLLSGKEEERQEEEKEEKDQEEKEEHQGKCQSISAATWFFQRQGTAE